MKRLNVKYWSIAVMCVWFLSGASAIAQTQPCNGTVYMLKPTKTTVQSEAMTPKAEVVSPTSTVGLQQQKMEVRARINAVKYERDRIASLKKKCKADNEAGKAAAVREDERQLTKAKGDLQKAKAYLKAEKDLFIDNYNLAIDAQREAVQNDRKMLSRARVKLDNDLAALNDNSDKDARDVIRYEKELARDKEVLSRKKVAMDNDILSLNKEIKQQNGQFIGSLYAENLTASTSKLFEK